MSVRTTLTIDDDLAHELRERAHNERRPFKDVVNEALRSGLHRGAPPRSRERFVVEPNDSGLVAGVDPRRLNQLLDEMDAAAFGHDDTR